MSTVIWKATKASSRCWCVESIHCMAGHENHWQHQQRTPFAPHFYPSLARRSWLCLCSTSAAPELCITEFQQHNLSERSGYNIPGMLTLSLIGIGRLGDHSMLSRWIPLSQVQFAAYSTKIRSVELKHYSKVHFEVHPHFWSTKCSREYNNLCNHMHFHVNLKYDSWQQKSFR